MLYCIFEKNLHFDSYENDLYWGKVFIMQTLWNIKNKILYSYQLSVKWK